LAGDQRSAHLRRPAHRRRPLPVEPAQSGLPAALQDAPGVRARPLARGAAGQREHGPAARRVLRRLLLAALCAALPTGHHEPGGHGGPDRGHLPGEVDGVGPPAFAAVRSGDGRLRDRGDQRARATPGQPRNDGRDGRDERLSLAPAPQPDGRWGSPAELAAILTRPTHLRRTIAVAAVVGTILFAINQLDVVLRGQATTAVWLTCG